MIQTVDKFVGVIGHITEGEDFSVLTSLLESARVIEEDEPIGTHVDYVETTYEINGKHYLLWYQVQTERTPEGWDYTFGFGEI